MHREQITPAEQRAAVPHGVEYHLKVTDRARFALDVSLTQESVFGNVDAPRLEKLTAFTALTHRTHRRMTSHRR